MRVDRERGFFFLEVLVAGLALLVKASCFAIYARSMELRVADGCRVRAVFLARTQFAAAQAEAAARGLAPGSYPWQGRAEDLQEGGIDYAVETNIGSEGGIEGNPAAYRVSVQVKWQGRAARGQLDLEREVVRHGSGE